MGLKFCSVANTLPSSIYTLHGLLSVINQGEKHRPKLLISGGHLFSERQGALGEKERGHRSCAF